MKGSFVGLQISHNCENKKKKTLSQIFALSVTLWHRYANFSVEQAWHAALCNKVWAQLERNKTKIRCSVHHLLSI